MVKAGDFRAFVSNTDLETWHRVERQALLKEAAKVDLLSRKLAA